MVVYQSQKKNKEMMVSTRNEQTRQGNITNDQRISTIHFKKSR